MDHVTRIFESRQELERTLEKLEAVGIARDQISILASDATRSRQFEISDTNKGASGASTGAAIGGVAGAVIAALMSAAAIAVPGMNVVVSGYLVSALAGLGAGAATGGLVGGLIGLGIPEYEAKIYEDRLKEGNILLSVKPIDDAQEKRIQAIFDEADKFDQKRPDLGPQDLRQSG